MLETNDTFINELALHIVTLADFWRRKNTSGKPGAELRIIRTLIETGLDINLEYIDPIASLVLKELDALDAAGFGHDANATKWRVEVVSTVLRQNAVIEKEPPTLFEASARL
jgi:hypothetical protein